METLNEYQIEAIIGSVAPVFTGEARYRLKLLRMALKLDQSQLAKALGVGVATVSNAENGAQTSRNPILMSKLISVFGAKGAVYILAGKYGSSFEEIAPHVHREYWKSKHAAQGNRTKFKDRVRYGEKSKYELLRENESLRAQLKESTFKNGEKKGSG